MSPYEDPNRWKALAVLGVAYLMVVLDVSIVNVALPSIQTELNFAPENLQWVISGYSLTFGGFLLLGGRVSWSVSGPSPSSRSRAVSPPPRAC
jgi:MFS family permease